jgi:hypothetical protein
MKNTLAKLIRLKALNLYRDFYREYTRETYNVTGDVCLIYSHDGESLFYMTDTHQGVCAASDEACIHIRKICGENKLMEYGLPQPDQITPHLVLAPTLSMLKVLGLKRFIKFLKDWNGVSSVGDIVVMKYSVII